MDWPLLVREYGYPAIALGTFLEGEMVLMAGGFAARQGWLDPMLVFASGSLGVLVSDQAWFCAGRIGGRRLLARWPKLQHRADAALAAVDRYRAWLAIGFQFAPGICTATPIAFGLSRISALRFLILDAIGIALWSTAMVAAGMASAAACTRLRAVFDANLLWLAALVALVILWRWHRRARAIAIAAATAEGGAAT